MNELIKIILCIINFLIFFINLTKQKICLNLIQNYTRTSQVFHILFITSLFSKHSNI